MEKKKNITLKMFIIALVMSIAAFITILMIEKMVLTNYEKVDVVVAKKDISAKTFISEDDADEYFEIMKVPKEALLENAITEMSEIKDYMASHDMQAKEQLTKNKMLNTTSGVLEEFEEPVEVSLMVDNLSLAVSGTLRKGDRVDIAAYTDVIEKKTDTILENVYVSGTYDTNGEQVTADSEAISSVVFNFIIERSDYISFLNGTSNGGVQLIKVSGMKKE